MFPKLAPPPAPQHWASPVTSVTINSLDPGPLHPPDTPGQQGRVGREEVQGGCRLNEGPSGSGRRRTQPRPPVLQVSVPSPHPCGRGSPRGVGLHVQPEGGPSPAHEASTAQIASVGWAAVTRQPATLLPPFFLHLPPPGRPRAGWAAQHPTHPARLSGGTPFNPWREAGS